jgi:ribosomal protein L29
MKKKDFTELREKSAIELIKLAMKKKTEAAKKRMEILAGKEKNLKAYKNLRSEVAKILTLVREKEILEKLQPEDNKKTK